MQALEGADLEAVKKKFIENARAYYRDIAKSKPQQKQNLKGWLNRLDSY